MTAISLYQVAAEFRALADRLSSLDEDEQVIADTLEGERLPLEDKARAVAAVVRNLEAEADAYSAHAKECADKARAIGKRVSSLRAYLLANLESCGVAEIKGPAMTIKIKRNPASVDIYDRDRLGAEFWRYPDPPAPEPDKKAIAAAIKAGEDVEGARLTQINRLDIS